MIENELLEPHQLEDPFRDDVRALPRRRCSTTASSPTARSSLARSRPSAITDTFEAVHGPLRHLIVDEYQDVNPAQEKLVELLAGEPRAALRRRRRRSVDLPVARLRRREHRRVRATLRARPPVQDPAEPPLAAEHRAGSPTTSPTNIENRLAEADGASTAAPTAGPRSSIWAQPSPEDEARVIAEAVRRAHDELGYDFSEIAILCRGRVSLPPILEALEELRVPVQSAGRTNLFLQPEADLFGRTIVWLIGLKWRHGGTYDWQDEEVDLDDLVERHRVLYELAAGPRQRASCPARGLGRSRSQRGAGRRT